MKSALVILAIACFCSPVFASITGTVVDPAGAPLAGVIVKAFAEETPQETRVRWLSGTLAPEPLASATTSKEGEFRFDKIGKPTAWIVVDSPGRAVIARSVADGDDAGAFVLAGAKVRHLHVTAGGKPVKEAIVGWSSFTAARTGADGGVDLTVSPGRELTVVAAGFAPLVRQLPEGGTSLALDTGTTLRGRTFAADGRTPVAGATISIDGWPLAKSGEDGTFAIVHAPKSWTTMRAVEGTMIAEATRGRREAFALRMQPAAIVSGLVRDSKTRKPVAGMLLDTPVDSAISGDDGRFTLAFVAGIQTLSATHPSYDLAPGGDMLTVPAAGLAVTLPAVPRPTMSGTVVDEDRKAVAAAVVTTAIRGYSRAPRPEPVATNRAGRFIVRLAVNDSGDVEFRKNGYASTVVPFKRGESKSGLQVMLKRGVPLVVRVIDRERAPVPGVTVAISEPRLGRQPGSYGPAQARQLKCSDGECVTGGDGGVKLQVAPGRYEIAVSGAGIVRSTLPIQDVDAKSGPVVAVVERGVDVSGRVVYADGAPTTGPLRITFEAPLMGSGDNGTTTSDGTFVLHGVPRGRVKLRAESTERGGFFGTANPATEVTAPADNVVLTMPRGGQIAGRAVDAASGQPLQNYTVMLIRASGGGFGGFMNSVKSEDGTFLLDNVSPGRFEVQATAPGFVRASAAGIEVVEGKTTGGVELRLEKGATVRGRVTSSDGDPVSEVFVVVASDRPMSGAGAGRTDASGEYELSSVPAGERNVTFMKEGFVTATKTVDAAVGKDTHLDVTLDRGREISGRVIDEAGDPVASADVNVEGASVRGVQSEGDGTFKISGLVNNRVRVSARKPGYTTARSDEIDPASGVSVVLTMRRGAVVNGHVSGVSDNELAYVMISARGTDSNGETRPDTSGNFTIPGVSDGRVSVIASLGAMQGSSRTAKKTIDVVSGIAPPVDLVLSSGYTISGHVRTTGGRNPGELFVMFFNLDGTNASSPVGADGAYSVSGLVAGDYRVMARAQFGPGLMYSGNYTVTGDGTYDIETQSFSVHGRVTDTNGTAIPDATVMVRLTPATPSGSGGTVSPPPPMQLPLSTDSNGRYGGETYGTGILHIEVQKPHYQTATKDVEVSEAMPDVDFQLQGGTPTLVRVVDGRDGSALVANVSASTPESGNAAGGGSRVTTREDGVAELWLAPGHYNLYVYAPNYAMNHATLDVPAAGETRIAMVQGGTVIVIDRDPAATVMLVAENDPSFRRGSSNGRFTNILPGAYKVQLMRSGKKVDEKSVQVVDGQTVTVTFE